MHNIKQAEILNDQRINTLFIKKFNISNCCLHFRFINQRIHRNIYFDTISMRIAQSLDHSRLIKIIRIGTCAKHRTAQINRITSVLYCRNQCFHRSGRCQQFHILHHKSSFLYHCSEFCADVQTFRSYIRNSLVMFTLLSHEKIPYQLSHSFKIC